MKAAKYKTLLLAGVVTMTWSLTTIAQTAATNQSADSTGRKAKMRKSADNSDKQRAPDSELENAGSPANVRHERIGSLDPGYIYGTKGSTGRQADTTKNFRGQEPQ